jgi:hypothetical protein
MGRFPQHRRRLRAAIALPLGIASVLAILLAISAAAGLAASSRTAVEPKNTAPATISGKAQVGETLTAQNGTWSGTEPITYTYQWRRCDESGGSCSDISGANDKTYVLKTVDKDNSIRVVVTAKNADGSATSTTVPTAVVTAAAATPAPTPTPTPTPDTGCPKTAQSNQAVAVTDVSSPARLLVDGFQVTSGAITFSMQSLTLKVHVSNTCGQPVQGAQVYATAVPFNQVSIPSQQATGSDGSVSLTFNRMAGFPATPKQQLLAMFIRASKPGEPILAGISTRRLISLRVSHG